MIKTFSISSWFIYCASNHWQRRMSAQNLIRALSKGGNKIGGQWHLRWLVLNHMKWWSVDGILKRVYPWRLSGKLKGSPSHSYRTQIHDNLVNSDFILIISSNFLSIFIQCTRARISLRWMHSNHNAHILYLASALALALALVLTCGPLHTLPRQPASAHHSICKYVGEYWMEASRRICSHIQDYA